MVQNNNEQPIFCFGPMQMVFLSWKSPKLYRPKEETINNLIICWPKTKKLANIYNHGCLRFRFSLSQLAERQDKRDIQRVAKKKKKIWEKPREIESERERLPDTSVGWERCWTLERAVDLKTSTKKVVVPAQTKQGIHRFKTFFFFELTFSSNWQRRWGRLPIAFDLASSASSSKPSFIFLDHRLLHWQQFLSPDKHIKPSLVFLFDEKPKTLLFDLFLSERISGKCFWSLIFIKTIYLVLCVPQLWSTEFRRWLRKGNFCCCERADPKQKNLFPLYFIHRIIKKKNNKRKKNLLFFFHPK